jgi:hypothetical protein
VRATDLAPDPGRSAGLVGHRGPDGERIGPEPDVRIEKLDERVEVTVACRGEEGPDHRSLTSGICPGTRLCSSHAPASPAGKLPRCGFRLPHDWRDLLEGDVEHVVQDEGHPLGRGEHLEHHEQRGTDRISQENVLLGTGVLVSLRWSPGVRVKRRLTP